MQAHKLQLLQIITETDDEILNAQRNQQSSRIQMMKYQPLLKCNPTDTGNTGNRIINTDKHSAINNRLEYR